MRDRIAVAVACAFASSACAGGTVADSPPPPEYQTPSSLPPPPPDVQAVPQGQWVQTEQYGWVWMPYADAYTYVPPDGTGEPLEYVYYPSYGWSWVAAPWMWGVGPWPAFGRSGPVRFAWYGHGWWRTPRRWAYRPAPERQGRVARGIRPAPPARYAPQARGGTRAAPPPRPEGKDQRDRR